MYDKICRRCGTRLNDFYNTSMLGCENCYKEFAPEIEIALKKMQGKTFHVGKTTSAFAEDKDLLKEYRDALARKERAGLEGRFNDMADLSVLIAEMSEELKRRGLI